MRSQLRDLLTYGWKGGTDAHDAVGFLDSLPPADDPSHVMDRLEGRRPRDEARRDA
jgi:hypothetical protein